MALLLSAGAREQALRRRVLTTVFWCVCVGVCVCVRVCLGVFGCAHVCLGGQCRSHEAPLMGGCMC